MKLQQSTVFISNNMQSIHLPAETRFPENVKRVVVRAVGNERILPPVDNTWDSFFISDNAVSDDFIDKRATQNQSEREEF